MKLDTKKISLPLASLNDKNTEKQYPTNMTIKKINQNMMIKVIQVSLHQKKDAVFRERRKK